MNTPTPRPRHPAVRPIADSQGAARPMSPRPAPRTVRPARPVRPYAAVESLPSSEDLASSPTPAVQNESSLINSSALQPPVRPRIPRAAPPGVVDARIPRDAPPGVVGPPPGVVGPRPRPARPRPARPRPPARLPLRVVDPRTHPDCRPARVYPLTPPVAGGSTNDPVEPPVCEICSSFLIN